MISEMPFYTLRKISTSSSSSTKEYLKDIKYSEIETNEEDFKTRRRKRRRKRTESRIFYMTSHHIKAHYCIRLFLLTNKKKKEKKKTRFLKAFHVFYAKWKKKIIIKKKNNNNECVWRHNVTWCDFLLSIIYWFKITTRNFSSILRKFFLS